MSTTPATPDDFNVSPERIVWQRKRAYELMVSTLDMTVEFADDIDNNPKWKKCLAHPDDGIRFCISTWIGLHGGPRAGEWLLESAVREKFESAQVMMLQGAKRIFVHYPSEVRRFTRFRKALRNLAESGSDKVSAAATELLARINKAIQPRWWRFPFW